MGSIELHLLKSVFETRALPTSVLIVVQEDITALDLRFWANCPDKFELGNCIIVRVNPGDTDGLIRAMRGRALHSIVTGDLPAFTAALDSTPNLQATFTGALARAVPIVYVENPVIGLEL